jgi:UDP-N-acetylmuramoyl-L-alanyl-D-glutamate--2,6-diaminopimelate ligase
MKAASGDSILIAGKGHEQYQQMGDEKIPFDDFKQARLALVKRRSYTGGQ